MIEEILLNGKPALLESTSGKVTPLPKAYRLQRADSVGIIGAIHTDGPRAGTPYACNWRVRLAGDHVARTVNLHPAGPNPTHNRPTR